MISWSIPTFMLGYSTGISDIICFKHGCSQKKRVSHAMQEGVSSVVHLSLLAGFIAHQQIFPVILWAYCHFFFHSFSYPARLPLPQNRTDKPSDEGAPHPPLLERSRTDVFGASQQLIKNRNCVMAIKCAMKTQILSLPISASKGLWTLPLNDAITNCSR